MKRMLHWQDARWVTNQLISYWTHAIDNWLVYRGIRRVSAALSLSLISIPFTLFHLTKPSVNWPDLSLAVILLEESIEYRKQMVRCWRISIVVGRLLHVILIKQQRKSEIVLTAIIKLNSQKADKSRGMSFTVIKSQHGLAKISTPKGSYEPFSFTPNLQPDPERTLWDQTGLRECGGHQRLSYFGGREYWMTN